MNKQQLAAKIWESANKMRSKIEANEYKDYILGFIFYKFLSEKEVKYLKENDWTDDYLPELTEEDTETVESVQKNLGYFISYDNLFSTWLEKGRDFSVQDVRDALSAFNRLINATHKKVFEGIFDTLQTGLSKLGDSAASQSKAVRDLIHLIKDIPMDGKQDYDVLGFIYEYLIGMFAANAGKKAGEFYTPHEVSLLMSEIVAEHLKDRNEIKIYDPTSGSGSLLINIGKSVAKFIDNENNIKYYAQELKRNTYNLTRMNLVMRGILPDNIVTRNGDTLEDDWPYFDENDPIGTYDPLYVDAVVSNPPYSQAWNPADKENDPRFARFGLAPKGKADYAFLLHDLFHLKSDGIMTIVLPHGVLFRGGEEGEIRKNLIEQNHIDAGSISLNGEELSRLPEFKRAKKLGRVFQDPMMGTAADMQIDENLALAYRRGKGRGLAWGVTKKEKELFREQLSRLGLGLEDRMTSKVGLLSGGQRQAITLLMATLQRPEMLLLDEHTAALDPVTAKKVLALSEELIREHSLTTMMVTHNMKDAIRHGNRLIMMNAGRIIFDVSGEAKQKLTVDDLMREFAKAGGDDIEDRALLS